MGWTIKCSKEKYRVWSTVVDEYITEDITKDELIRFLFWNRFENLMDNMLEYIICFPKGWTDKTTGNRLNCEPEKNNEYFEILGNRDKKFKLFLAEIKELGIFIDIKDIDGVDIHTENNVVA